MSSRRVTRGSLHLAFTPVTKFFIPPFTMLVTWALVFLCAQAGRTAFRATRPLLVLTLLTSLISCSYVALRLRPRRREAQARQPYLLNVIAIIAFFVLLAACAGRRLLIGAFPAAGAGTGGAISGSKLQRTTWVKALIGSHSNRPANAQVILRADDDAEEISSASRI